MKKLFSYVLVVVLLLSFGLSSVAAAPSDAQGQVIAQVNMSEVMNLTQMGGTEVIGNGTHSGHQTRIVHTTHGDYVAYLSDEIKDERNGGTVTLNEFSIVKVQDGEATILYQDYVPVDSSSISIFADENGEVYAVTLNSNKFNNLPGTKETANLAVWHVDSETDKVTGYTATQEFSKTNGYGYAQPVIDTVSGKIYALFSGGDEPGEIAWFIFDLATMSWEKTPYAIEVPTRHCYHYAYADGKGGMVVVNQQDRKAATAGHDEIPTAPLWSANYVWDQLDMYYIPSMYDDSLFYSYSVEEADYSRVKDLDGDGLYTSDEERQTNEYPNVLNNHSGDTYLDSQGHLHVLYTVVFARAAYDRKTVEETQWHAVYDISDPANVQLLSKEQMYFEGYNEETPDKNSYEFRMAEDADGTLYIVAMHCSDTSDSGNLLLYKLSKAGEGYNYDLVYKSDKLLDSKVNTGMSVSGSRSISVRDNSVSLIFTADIDKGYISGPNESHDMKDWYYLTLNLPAQIPLAITTTEFADAFVGKSYQQSIDVSYSGADALTFTATGLPKGLSINASTGMISGKPGLFTQKDTPYEVVVTVSDGVVTDTQTIQLKVRNKTAEDFNQGFEDFKEKLETGFQIGRASCRERV